LDFSIHANLILSNPIKLTNNYLVSQHCLSYKSTEKDHLPPPPPPRNGNVNDAVRSEAEPVFVDP
jgi:hypothetical protein